MKSKEDQVKKNPFKKVSKKILPTVKGKTLPAVMTDATEEHRIILPGIDIAINHTLKLIVMVDQTGVQDHTALDSLQFYLEGLGYFLHCVIVAPPTDKEVSE